MVMSLLTTKICIPSIRSDLVPRPRVIDLLRKEVARPLTLICAPAGFGKTTLVAEWLGAKGEGHPSQVAWLSLDETDNDPARFLTYLLATLHNIDSAIGAATQAMMQSPQPPPAEVMLTALINDLAAVPKDFFLILDDYHCIHTLAIHQQLAFLLGHQPSQMHFVITSREDPPLPLARLRARGLVLEIRQDDLRFTEDETADLMQRMMQIDLSRDDVAALHRRTEGWVAGLQLACLSLRGHTNAHQFIESFTGSNRFVLDYLMEEVFAQQSPAVCEFLLKTSILERMCGALCDAVWKLEGRSGKLESESNVQQLTSGQQILEHLEHANLFVVPLDTERQWYRYHRLFGDLLRHRLQLETPDAITELHNRASVWYAVNSFPIDAIHHALAARNWEHAGTLIDQSAGDLLMRGESVTLLNWYRALPDEFVRAHPQLSYGYGWALILTGQLDAAESYLRRAEVFAQTLHDDPFLGNIYAAQAQIARTRGDHQRTVELSRSALALMPTDAVIERSTVALNLGIAYLGLGQVGQASLALDEAERTAQQVGNHHVRLIALTFLGIIQVVRGRLHGGQEFFLRTIQSGGGSPATALAHLHYGALLYEWNDLNAAIEHLQCGLELSRRGGNPEIEISAYRTLALIKQAQGDAPGARATIEEAWQFATAHKLPPIMHAAIAANYVQIALVQDDVPTAARWAEQAVAEAGTSALYPMLGLARARVLIAQKQCSAAMTELNKGYENISRMGWEGGLITIRVLQALVAETHNARLEFLTDALKRAQPEAFIRTFADVGETLLPLLQDAAQLGTHPEYVGKIMSAIKRKPAQSLIEPLSERETQVLRLVAAGLSNSEIAEKLILSEGTIKTHVHNIYGKLDAQNRAQAVDRARELRII